MFLFIHTCEDLILSVSFFCSKTIRLLDIEGQDEEDEEEEGEEEEEGGDGNDEGEEEAKAKGGEKDDDNGQVGSLRELG